MATALGTIGLINALLPLVANLEPLVVSIIAQLRAQPGMTDEQILAHARTTNNENLVALVAERLRLQAEIDAQTLQTSLEGGVK